MQYTFIEICRAKCRDSSGELSVVRECGIQSHCEPILHKSAILTVILRVSVILLTAAIVGCTSTASAKRENWPEYRTEAHGMMFSYRMPSTRRHPRTPMHVAVVASNETASARHVVTTVSSYDSDFSDMPGFMLRAGVGWYDDERPSFASLVKVLTAIQAGEEPVWLSINGRRAGVAYGQMIEGTGRGMQDHGYVEVDSDCFFFFTGEYAAPKCYDTAWLAERRGMFRDVIKSLKMVPLSEKK